jgi:hypothetical protein
MHRYMARNTFNEVGTSGLLGQGFAARAEQFRELIAPMGGVLEGYYLASSGQVVVIMSFEHPQNLALSSFQTMASGALLVMPDWQEIYTGEEMDAALAQQTVAYRPPGS